MNAKTNAPATRTTTPLRRWDPFERLAQMQSEFDRLVGDRLQLSRLSELPDAWAPKTDVFEQDGAIVVQTELPGVEKDAIDIEVENGDLVIHGERRAEEKVEDKDYYRMERSYGSFYRRLPMPEGVKPDQIEATYVDGVLKVKVPKPAPSTPSQTRVAIK